MSAKPEYLSTLTPKQHHALTLLAEGQSITAVAKTCDVHRTTIQYWKRTNTEFAFALHDAIAEHADHWRSESHKRAEAALALIDAFLADPKIPASVRLKAALHILTSATAPPPRFQPAHQEDPYRAANQMLAQMRHDTDAHLKAVHESYEARRPHPQPATDSSLFITADTKATPIARLTSPDQQNSSLFNTPHPDEEYKVATIRHAEPPTGRNKPCPCNSGRKYKHCCLGKPKAA